MKNQITFNSEWTRRTDLINNADFRAMCAKHAQASGVTVEEWNTNKVGILMMMANELCALQNKLNK